jgi:pSer/pThr/pTyr-binding forkhead associated (FHA) protein
VKDLNSQNGTRVNGYRVTKRRVDPHDILTLAKYDYEVNYLPSELGAFGPPPDGGDLDDILSSSLLETAGLNRKERQASEGRIGRNRPAPQRPPVSAEPPAHRSNDEDAAPEDAPNPSED